jgi:hypothetical protein
MDDTQRARFEAKYGVWKSRLLDISARNRLLNFRPTKVTTVNVTTPQIDTLFSKLVLEERPLKFPLYQGKTILRLSDPDDDDSDPPEPEYRVRPGDIETTKSPPDLEKSLYRLTQIARSSREERGVNTLYLALASLAWRPQDGAGWQSAPLLMVPVNLSREDHLHPYILSPLDEDAEVNPTLIYMLRMDFEFYVPEFPDQPNEDSLENFLKSLEKSVAAMEWRVERDAWLAQFQFKKLAMYKDMEEHEEEAPDSRLVAGIANCGSFSSEGEGIAYENFDAVRPSDVFTVLDADSSQVECVLRARAGDDLIIQGPPGTGKSQTITNLIAQSLYEGKKVLFVSEKMAALSVVYSRLQEVGLAPFCLELHSDKANKRDVLQRIRRAMSVGTRGETTARYEFDALLSLRSELNDYSKALHEPLLHGRSAYALHGEIALLGDVPDVAAQLNLDAATTTPDKEQSLLRQARRLAQMAGMLTNYYSHPWYGCVMQEWSLERQGQIGARLTQLSKAISSFRVLCEDLGSRFHIEPPANLDSAEAWGGLKNTLAAAPTPPGGWLAK